VAVRRSTGGVTHARSVLACWPGRQTEWQAKRSQVGKATEDVETLIESFGRVMPAYWGDIQPDRPAGPAEGRPSPAPLR
jgi:hypothetical protein